MVIDTHTFVQFERANMLIYKMKIIYIFYIYCKQSAFQESKLEEEYEQPLYRIINSVLLVTKKMKKLFFIN